MYATINSMFNRSKKNAENDQFIMESVLSVEEVLPGSDDEIDDVIDVGSVPDEAYKKLDAALDKIVSDPKYDDTEAEELVDGDDIDDDDISDDELDAIVNEAVDSVPDEAWEDNEEIGHPAKRNNANDTREQPEFEDKGQNSL